ncbi:hypothetical protein EMIHUDRAFT_240551 [Emiliania huxleyi CCMP1516]|uniref:UBC core domain-containing protein n=2 Tax=Emiliania huxleyi TaxID=2903 RepID=A0A0D3JEV9_EMIH1|nr:hypothetical protein EMIHUDRAFT_240551 [Emiliania huxleyi CCMP1516]EOD22044.1 hypothetical protein EMIHUDRAFT_240551 [Emiliania huxleyi CCMP1516]|eukprot:XP_005774473.1 hypothetical protein EMIHUDRAFT_240551 [Emiliania huxleyi CCMP1516]
MVNHRLLKEYKELAKQNDPEISLSLADEADINGWEARGTRGLRGPAGTPYEGGTFEIRLT